jgi:hypothetical protein
MRKEWVPGANENGRPHEGIVKAEMTRTTGFTTSIRISDFSEAV